MPNVQRLVVSVCGAAILAGCGGDAAPSLSLTGAPGVTGYVASSLLSPAGHSVEAIGEGRVRVTATGSAATPRQRVEKIALARAAEYGAETNQKFVLAEPPSHSIKCGPRDRLERGKRIKLPVTGYQVVTIDASYAQTATGTGDTAAAGFLPSKATADALKAELAADPLLTASNLPIDPEIAAQCGL